MPRVRGLVEERGGEVRVTCRAGDERLIARRAAASGAATIIALGGDGTWSNVARGVLDAETVTRIALLAGGTGNDFARNVGAPANDVSATLDLAFNGAARNVDVGYVNDVAFVNSCGVGFDVAVVQALGTGGSSLGPLAYMLTAARKLWRFPALRATIGTHASAQSYLVIVIGNGARFGGGMLLAPHATIDDGLLDLIAVRDVPAVARVRTLLAASRGKHLALRGVEHRAAQTFTLSFETPPLFEVDGEVFRSERSDLHVRCEPKRLRICAP